MQTGETKNNRLRARVSNVAPREARIISRTTNSRSTPAYTVQIGTVTIPEVGISEILDFVSHQDLESFENSVLQRETNEGRLQGDPAKVIKPVRVRTRRNPRFHIEFLAFGGNRTSFETDESGAEPRSQDEGKISGSGTNDAGATGRGRPRPSYAHLYPKGQGRRIETKVTGRAVLPIARRRRVISTPAEDEEEEDKVVTAATLSMSLNDPQKRRKLLHNDPAASDSSASRHTPVLDTVKPPSASPEKKPNVTVVIKTASQQKAPSVKVSPARSLPAEVSVAEALPQTARESSTSTSHTSAPSIEQSISSEDNSSSDIVAEHFLQRPAPDTTSSSHSPFRPRPAQTSLQQAIPTDDSSDSELVVEHFMRRPAPAAMSIPLSRVSPLRSVVQQTLPSEVSSDSRSSSSDVVAEHFMQRPAPGVTPPSTLPPTTTSSLPTTNGSNRPPSAKPGLPSPAQRKLIGPSQSQTRPYALLDTLIHPAADVDADSPSVASPSSSQSSTYEIERIVSHAMSDPTTHNPEYGAKPIRLYKVKWVGYDETTWEPATSFDDESIVSDYWTERRRAKLSML